MLQMKNILLMHVSTSGHRNQALLCWYSAVGFSFWSFQKIRMIHTCWSRLSIISYDKDSMHVLSGITYYEFIWADMHHVYMYSSTHVWLQFSLCGKFDLCMHNQVLPPFPFWKRGWDSRLHFTRRDYLELQSTHSLPVVSQFCTVHTLTYQHCSQH